MENYKFTFLSLGAGLQSSALTLASHLGIWNIPPIDQIFFSDTGEEPHWVYNQLQQLKDFCSTPITVVSAGHRLGDALMKPEAFTTIPAYTKPRGMGRMQCNRVYKIVPIRKAVRAAVGLKPRQRARFKVLNLVGYSADEAHRLKPSYDKWIDVKAPLIEANKTRADCQQLLSDHGFKNWRRSSCMICPLQSNHNWCRLHEDGYPNEWKRIIDIDNAIRNLILESKGRTQYLHRYCKPIDDIPWNEIYSKTTPTS